MGRRIGSPMGGKMMQMKVARVLGSAVDIYRVASNQCNCNVTIDWDDVEQNWTFLYVPIDIQFNHQDLPAFDEWIHMEGR